MLPDYPRAKKELSAFLLERINTIKETLTLEVTSESVHEGDLVSYTRDDGSNEMVEFREFTASIEIPVEQYPTMTWNDVVMKCEEAAENMGNDMFRHMLEGIDEITKQTGNRVDVGGILTAEKFFEIIEKIEIPFDAEGRPVFPTIVGGEVASKAMKKVFEEISCNKQLQGQFENILREQKERWRDRESARKLVD